MRALRLIAGYRNRPLDNNLKPVIIIKKFLRNELASLYNKPSRYLVGEK